MELRTSIFQNQAATQVADNVIPLCELARELEEAGEFEGALETLRPFWRKLGERPETDGLAAAAKAELLLRAGSLTGWLGSSMQVAGSQELAKDLVSESATIFEMLGLTEKTAEARVDLAICYWREGALDEARVTLRHVLETLGEKQSEQRLRALLNSAIVEKVATRDTEALRIYREAAPLFDLSSNHALKGKFHNSMATLLKSMGLSENREEYIDKALLEFAAASFHFEQAGHQRFQGRVENNVGFLFASIGRFEEAQEHLNRARVLLLNVGDHGGAAGCDDTRAQAFLLEGKNADAEKVAGAAVQALKSGGEQTLLAEALTTHGKALARLSKVQVAKTSLDQALDIAQGAGDPDRGGIAAITVIEELAPNLSADAMQEYYRKAEALLANSQNRSIKTRLGECARRVLAAEFARTKQELAADHPKGELSVSVEAGLSLEAEVLRYEGNLIRRALESCGGSVTRAARLLGVTHQGLAFILNGRHSDLLSIRTPVKRRRRSIIRYH
jgi:tetratricopeptide (TPR) repeat protein